MVVHCARVRWSFLGNCGMGIAGGGAFGRLRRGNGQRLGHYGRGDAAMVAWTSQVGSALVETLRAQCACVAKLLLVLFRLLLASDGLLVGFWLS